MWNSDPLDPRKMQKRRHEGTFDIETKRQKHFKEREPKPGKYGTCKENTGLTPPKNKLKIIL